MKVLFSVMNVFMDMGDLTDMCTKLLPQNIEIKLEDCKDGNINEVHYRRFTQYKEYDFVVCLDIDCFIIRPQAILDMCQFMQDIGFSFAAMNELTGPSTHRNKCYGVDGSQYNAFFYILNTKLIPPMPSIVELNKQYLKPNTDLNRYEPYWVMFQFVYRNTKIYIDLKGYTHTDGITTVLYDINDKPMLMHTWYARCWKWMQIEREANCIHRIRIKRIYDEVLNARN